MTLNYSYLKQNALSVDQLLNTLTGGFADETLSSRAYRTDKAGKVFGRIFRPLIDNIFFWQDSHCYKAFISEKNRTQLPKELR